MATNLSMDRRLIERAVEVSGGRAKKAAVTRASEEFIARRRQKRLIELMGKVEWDKSFDYTAERSRRQRCSSRSAKPGLPAPRGGRQEIGDVVGDQRVGRAVDRRF